MSNEKYKNKEWLSEQYLTYGKSIKDIAKELGSCKKTISRYLKKFSIIKEESQREKERQGKIRKTNLDRLGVENPFLSSEIKKKICKTNIEKFGSDNPFGSKSIQLKIKETNLERYGVENPILNENIKNKAINSTIKKYGVDNVFKLPAFQKTARESTLKRYGVSHYTQSKEHRENSSKHFIGDLTAKDFSEESKIPYSTISSTGVLDDI
jgi:hypothetical protein